MPKKARQIRRGIYLGRSLYELVRLGDSGSVRRIKRELVREPRRTYLAAIRTANKLAGGKLRKLG